MQAAPGDIVDDVPTTNAELQDRIKSIFKLSGVPGRIFDYLRDGPRSRAEIAQYLGYEEGNTSFRVLLGKLTTKKVASKNEANVYQLTSMCFHHG